MSTLQFWLIVAGILLVVGVILYNGWQERRARRRIADGQRKDPTQAIIAPNAASRVEPTLGGVASVAAHHSGAARASVQPGTSRPVPPPSEAFAIPMDDVRRGSVDASADQPETDEMLDERGPTTAVADRATREDTEETAPSVVEHWTPGARPDPDIECVVTLQPVKPVSAGALAAGLHARLGKPLRWFGRTSNGAWHLLGKDTQGTFTELAACLLLADRNGPISRGQIETFVRVVSDVAPTLPAAFVAPEVEEEVTRAEALDKLCAEVDVQVGLTVLKGEPASIPGTRLRGVAEAAGFKLSPSGKFELIHDETGAVLYSLQNLRNEPFTQESLRLTATNGVVLLLDVPRVSDPLRVFDQMKLAAKRLALTLGGEVVDDNRRLLDDAALVRTREQVEEAAGALREVHIEPGSARALALFNA